MEEQMINRIMTVGRTVSKEIPDYYRYPLREICDIMVVRKSYFNFRGIFITPIQIRYFKVLDTLEETRLPRNYMSDSKDPTNLRILRSKDDKRINIKYVYYYLIHKLHENYNSFWRFFDEFSDRASSETNNTENDKIGDFIIRVPDPDVQERIVDMLDIIYNKYIETSNKKIDELNMISDCIFDNELLKEVRTNDFNDVIKKALNDDIDNNILMAHRILNKTYESYCDRYNSDEEDEEHPEECVCRN